MDRRILVPVDGSPMAERGFEEALTLSRALGSTPVLLVRHSES
jgi:nucleotide-binding universal stress UspA family protein